MTVPFCVPSDHRVIATRQWGRVQGLTVAPEGQTQGVREFISFRPGFYVAMGKLVHAGNRLDVYPSGDFFKLHFRLAGRSRVGQARARGSQPVVPMSMSTLVQPQDSYKEEFFAAGEQERSLTLCCSRAFLRDELGLEGGPDAADPMNVYLHSARRPFELRQFPLHPEQIELAGAALDGADADPHRGLFIESKAYALLHSVLRHTAQDGAPAGSVLAHMVEVKRHIDTHLAEAIDLPALARRHGMTERRLAHNFRQAYGQTVAEYLGATRMKQARLVLEAGQASVTEAAFMVGYSHVANFSTAFKRAFGISPRAATRRAPPAPRPA